MGQGPFFLSYWHAKRRSQCVDLVERRDEEFQGFLAPYTKKTVSLADGFDRCHGSLRIGQVAGQGLLIFPQRLE